MVVMVAEEGGVEDGGGGGLDDGVGLGSLYKDIYSLSTTDIGRCGDGRSFQPFRSFFFGRG